MFKGTVYALSACFVWGLIFVVPQFMSGFSAIEVALGRYAFYGIISLFIFSRAWLQGNCRYPLQIWIKALFFSLVTTIIYYTCLVLALRYSTPAICALILGISPIAIAYYGNWKQKECSFKKLILPSILILAGLVIINVPHLEASDSSSRYILGLLCSLFALISWSWYVVANSQFLKNNSVSSNEWSTMIGVATLFWVILCGLILIVGFKSQLDIQKYVSMSPELINFLIGCAILGSLCSWLGAFLWNKASIHLPVSLAGQLMIFETIFGVLFVYTVAQDLPSKMDLFGILLLLGAVAYGISNRAYAQLSHS